MNNKVTLLSTRKTVFFKILAFLFWVSIPCVMVLISVYTSNEIFLVILIGGTYGIMSFKQIMMVLKLKSITYNDSYLYIKLKGYVQEIPLEEIKNIKLKDVSGIYCLELDETHGRQKIFFKSSLWYPFNFRKVDNQVDGLYRIIKQKKQNFLKNFIIEHKTVTI